MIVPAGMYWIEEEVVYGFDVRCPSCSKLTLILHEIHLGVNIGKLQKQLLIAHLCDKCFLITGLPTTVQSQREITLDNVTPQDFL